MDKLKNQSKILITGLFLSGLLIGVLITLIVTKKNQILSVLPLTCTYNNQIYKHGESFKPEDGCGNCGCQNGQIICSTEACVNDLNQTEPDGAGFDQGFDPYAGPTETPHPFNMLTYTDPRFGFSIAYPDTDFIKSGKTKEANLVQEVLFYDKELAKSDTTNLQPPSCAIYVYTNNDRTPLAQWIAKNKPYEYQNGPITSATIGNTQGYKVTFEIMIYPGEFYFIEQGNYVYELIYCGDEVLRSFKINTN